MAQVLFINQCIRWSRRKSYVSSGWYAMGLFSLLVCVKAWHSLTKSVLFTPVWCARSHKLSTNNTALSTLSLLLDTNTVTILTSAIFGASYSLVPLISFSCVVDYISLSFSCVPRKHINHFDDLFSLYACNYGKYSILCIRYIFLWGSVSLR